LREKLFDFLPLKGMYLHRLLEVDRLQITSLPLLALTWPFINDEKGCTIEFDVDMNNAGLPCRTDIFSMYNNTMKLRPRVKTCLQLGPRLGGELPY
jgi:hypothetical protein